MNLHDELGAQRQAITEKTPRHVFPTIEAATERLKDAGLVASSPQQLNTEPGASVYSPTILKLYDLGVVGLSHRFVWQCRTKTVLLPFYKEHLEPVNDFNSHL